MEFLFPISRSLMVDPVIVSPSSHTFERSCIEACADLGFTSVGLNIDLYISPTLFLVPKVALKSVPVDFCHSYDIYHRNLKPEDLLLDDKGDLKVSYFGSTCSIHRGERTGYYTTCGMLAYDVAPKVINKKGYDATN
ncbi:hypothetical protein Cni_G23164 [Canna indica]|uniref:Protein kinase domain-containing protein n=1 Tax=Canna indica TaxID=4628 RepID=A0AAQ3QK76_9LILI|nr:hypothetical protein Cni_G23164 [Canna indica]